MFNDMLDTRVARGWNARGKADPEGGWNSRVYLHQLIGLYFDIYEPGSHSIKLNGTGAISINWGRGYGYFIKFEALDKTYTTVYPDIGRFDVVIKGDVHKITVLDNLGDRSLKGEIRAFANLERLEELRLPGSSLYGAMNALSGLSHLRYLDISDGLIGGVIDDWPHSLREITLRNTPIGGDLAVLADTAGLISLDLRGSMVSAFSASTLPNWADGVFLELTDILLDTNSIDRLINALGGITTSYGTLRIGGSNARRSHVSNHGITALRLRGWELTYHTGGIQFGGVTAKFGDASVKFGDAPYRSFAADDATFGDFYATFYGVY